MIELRARPCSPRDSALPRGGDKRSSHFHLTHSAEAVALRASWHRGTLTRQQLIEAYVRLLQAST